MYTVINNSEELGDSCPETFPTREEAEARRRELIDLLSRDLEISPEDPAFRDLVIDEDPQ